MGLLRPEICDDRGRVVAGPAFRPGDHLPLGFKSLRRFAWWLLGGVVVSAAMTRSWSTLLLLPVFGAAAALLVANDLMRHHTRTRFARDFRRDLADGRCPSCGQLLEEAGLEDDGCTVCPKCGAAWRLEGTKS